LSKFCCVLSLSICKCTHQGCFLFRKNDWLSDHIRQPSRFHCRITRATSWANSAKDKLHVVGNEICGAVGFLFRITAPCFYWPLGLVCCIAIRPNGSAWPIDFTLCLVDLGDKCCVCGATSLMCHAAQLQNCRVTAWDGQSHLVLQPLLKRLKLAKR
jgi:hypothetical protein